MQDVNADSRGNDFFSDAMIAEMEADIYGLQVCFLFHFSRAIEVELLIK